MGRYRYRYVRFVGREGSVGFGLEDDADRVVVLEVGSHAVGFPHDDLPTRFVTHGSFTRRDDDLDVAEGEGHVTGHAVFDGGAGDGGVGGLDDEFRDGSDRVSFGGVDVKVLEELRRSGHVGEQTLRVAAEADTGVHAEARVGDGGDAVRLDGTDQSRLAGSFTVALEVTEVGRDLVFLWWF